MEYWRNRTLCLNCYMCYKNRMIVYKVAKTWPWLKMHGLRLFYGLKKYERKQVCMKYLRNWMRKLPITSPWRNKQSVATVFKVKKIRKEKRIYIKRQETVVKVVRPTYDEKLTDRFGYLKNKRWRKFLRHLTGL